MSRALAAVAFLSSHDVQFITGEPIVVDGGQMAEEGTTNGTN